MRMKKTMMISKIQKHNTNSGDDSMLIELKDGKIENIYTDNCYTRGCLTCDFGSSYVNDVTIIMTKYRIFASIDTMYSYAMSEDWLLKTIIRNIDQVKQLTELEFADWFEDQFDELCGDKSYTVTSIES